MDTNLILPVGAGLIVGAVALLTSLFFVFKNKKQKTTVPEDDKINVTIPIAETVAPANKEEEQVTSLKQAMLKTEESFFGRIKKALGATDTSQIIDQIEEILYTSDLGPKTVEKLLSIVRDKLSKSDLLDISKVKEALKYEIESILKDLHQAQSQQGIQILDIIRKAENGPTVIMILGVNGAGKTTTIGKLAAQLAQSGQKVLVAAGDTFRAAAGGQLKVWTDRAQQSTEQGIGSVEIFWPEHVSDPAAISFDAASKAKAQNFDFVLLDTAGRLHTQSNLMEELKKVKRVMTKVVPEAPHNTWIVLDANSGQNALNQAIEFNKALELSGVVLTKLDGTAKGGVAIGLVDNLNLPIKLIGVGEKINDLRVFNYQEYVESILGQ